MTSSNLAGCAGLRPMGSTYYAASTRGTIDWHHFLGSLSIHVAVGFLHEIQLFSPDSDLSFGVSLVGFGQGKGLLLSKDRLCSQILTVFGCCSLWKLRYCKSRIFRMHVIFVYFVRGSFRTKIKCMRKVQGKSENPQRSATVRKFHAYKSSERPGYENWVRTKYSGFTVFDFYDLIKMKVCCQVSGE